MPLYPIVITIITTIILANCVAIENSNLVLVHTIFRHGDRTPIGDDSYPNNPYANETYYPYGLGQLTNKGKMKEYEIGVALKKRYDEFLGKNYFPELINARSSDENRTKTSLELMLAGLFPPTAELIWKKNLLWQPIPYNYVENGHDPVISYPKCPNFYKLFSNYVNSLRIQKRFEDQEYIFEYVSKHSGLNVTSYSEMRMLYFETIVQTEWGLPLPKWAEPIFPYPLENFTIAEYRLKVGTKELKQLTAGAFLRKMIEDTKAKINHEKWINDTKMFIYSGHESNLAVLLLALGNFKPHIPPYGAYLLIEVHKIDCGYGFKFLYQDYSNPEPTLLRIRGCEKLCPFDKFVSLVADYLPKISDEELCSSGKRHLYSSVTTNLVMLFSILFFFYH